MSTRILNPSAGRGWAWIDERIRDAKTWCWFAGVEALLVIVTLAAASIAYPGDGTSKPHPVTTLMTWCGMGAVVGVGALVGLLAWFRARRTVAGTPEGRRALVAWRRLPSELRASSRPLAAHYWRVRLAYPDATEHDPVNRKAVQDLQSVCDEYRRLRNRQTNVALADSSSSELAQALVEALRGL